MGIGLNLYIRVMDYNEVKKSLSSRTLTEALTKKKPHEITAISLDIQLKQLDVKDKKLKIKWFYPILLGSSIIGLSTIFSVLYSIKEKNDTKTKDQEIELQLSNIKKEILEVKNSLKKDTLKTSYKTK